MKESENVSVQASDSKRAHLTARESPRCATKILSLPMNATVPVAPDFGSSLCSSSLKGQQAKREAAKGAQSAGINYVFMIQTISVQYADFSSSLRSSVWRDRTRNGDLVNR